MPKVSLLARVRAKEGKADDLIAAFEEVGGSRHHDQVAAEPVDEAFGKTAADLPHRYSVLPVTRSNSGAAAGNGFG